MRKNVFGRRFKRDTNERKALFKQLMSSLVLYGRIKTTEQKAKAIKGQVEKLVTKAKKRGDQARNFLAVHLTPTAIEKLIKEVAPRFQTRPGGYTRILRIQPRVADSAAMVILEWVEGRTTETPATTETQKFSASVIARKPSTKGKIVKQAKKRTSSKTRKK